MAGNSQVETVDQGGIIARWIRAEQAFDLVRMQGKSLRQAAEVLGVTHDTVWRDVKAYEQYLAKTMEGPVDEKRATFLQRCNQVLDMAKQVFDNASDKSLNKTAALNTMVSVFGHIRAVQGLDVPKDAQKAPPGAIRISWGDEEGTVTE